MTVNLNRPTAPIPAAGGRPPAAEARQPAPPGGGSPSAARWVGRYTAAVSLLGAGLLGLALLQSPPDLRGVLVFAALASISEMASVELFQGTRQSRVSLSSAIAMASLLLFGPAAAALTYAGSGLTTLVTTNLLKTAASPGDRRVAPLRRSAFNIGMFTTAVILAGWVYQLAGGQFGAVAQLRNVLPLVAAVTAETLANLALLIGVIALQTGRRPGAIWRQDFRWSAPITIAAGVVGGGALASAYDMFGVFGLAVFLLPVLSAGYSLRLYMANMRQIVDRLEKLNDDLEVANLELMETLGAVIDAYDAYTSGHSTQVAVYAAALAEKLGLAPDDQALLLKAGLVHDIGKVGISDSLITKPGRLTEEEYNLVKRHPAIGAEIVGRMTGLQVLVPLVRHHHERWDGQGYPDGLQGREIPRLARILTLADTLDAMCSDRPYRRTMSFREVKEEIVNCSGTQFDPEVVEAFLALAQAEGGDFFKNSASSVDRAVLLKGDADGRRDARHFLKKSQV